MAMLSFNGRVQIAIERARTLYPDAEFLEAQGHSSAGLIEHPAAIDQLRVLFRRDGGATLMVEETGYGTFDNPASVDSIPSGATIDWPIGMDLPDADRLKEQFGYTEPYSRVALRIPQGVTWAHASYVFGGNPQCADVLVDTVTGKVREAG
jgi:hypothetical protein